MKHYDYLTGYKATNEKMQCVNKSGVFQFELGKWYKHEGELSLCHSGFHFCIHPSGPWNYYSEPNTRIFKVEAKNVVEEYEPGADLKVVCSELRFIEEIKFTGDQNTGYRNTGDQNTGYRNTGDRNTGDQNTGDQNTGYQNTGSRNTGSQNTGDGNTGDQNTGDRNTGYRNTGSRNTGYGNATNNSAGFFCQKEPFVISFDKQTKLTRQEFISNYPDVYKLSELLMADIVFDYTLFKTIPGWTLKKCKALHQKHIACRRKCGEK